MGSKRCRVRKSTSEMLPSRPSWTCQTTTRLEPLLPPEEIPLINPVNPAPEEREIPILFGTPTLGTIRIEWHDAIVGLVTPPNFALVRSRPMGYQVQDAQNMLVDHCLRGPYRVLLLIEDDTIPHPGYLLAVDKHIWRAERRIGPPIVSGLYHIKGSQETRRGKAGGIEPLGLEPLVYRGGGSRAYRDWTPGDLVWVDGVPTGALMIHRRILEAWAEEPDVPMYSVPGYPHPIRKIFERPALVWTDPDGMVHTASGTSDLYFSKKTLERNILTKAGYPAFAKRKYPYLIDTSPEMTFKHIDRLTGTLF